MRQPIDRTHDRHLRSCVESANQPDTDFPIQNLPLGVFRHLDLSPRIGVAIGESILDLTQCHETGLLSGLPTNLAQACTNTNLNALMGLGNQASILLRHRVSELLKHQPHTSSPAAECLWAKADVELLLPATIGDYTDFYASIFHATHVGQLFRPDQPLLPNYKHIPIAYHGRASSIVPSGTHIQRPWGQCKPPNQPLPSFTATQQLDYELEVGCFVGVGNELGQPVSIDFAPDYLFGICLVNDWSARDIQAWEYQPLGPFLGKSFTTTISPWVVTMGAIAPFYTKAFSRPEGDPSPLPYLDSATDIQSGGINLIVTASLQSAQMRAQGIPPIQLSQGSFQQMYWTLAQMLTHHTSNGCNLRSGDLLASGTISGAEDGSLGCLLEQTKRGANPITLPTGEIRSFLADGDEVILHGYCEAEGYNRIGLGECRGIVVRERKEK
ncbi:fumarylacetoacetase [Merismopedia glauca]|uniref:fumarylacetoacetase n=1 Tax=Merismopedia glauca CCAP 1448/3 TaxID=1296344 RepID=A0A2T1C4J0_9CYAN|nr:fumarylacetoacetase [Merismopedia glauca]PSB03057.1 fumarylacetoacetase [Merismopedia glauca CCAP 1448/3]